jgi:ribonuclease BN (tRNA processing enzyme)
VEIRLLGSGGWIPTEERECCSCLVRDGDAALAIDAGTGLRRLVTQPSLLDGVERLHIVLTHWHLDHTNGLVYFPLLGVPVEVWARPPTAALLHRLLDSPFLLSGDQVLEDGIAGMHDLEPPGARIGPFDVRVRVQPLHPDTSYALRLGDELAYCTDTAYDEENAEFARGVRVLAHDAFHAGETTDDPTHTSSGEAARIAAAACVERLVLIHTHPLLGDDEDLLEHARPVFANVEVGRDGLVL